MNKSLPGKTRKGALVPPMIFLLLLMLSLYGCRTIKYVPIETVKYDSIYITVWQKDSIYIHDSIFQKEKGDTVLIEKWHTKYIEKQVHDTLYKEKIDSIAVPYPVEKQLSRWQKIKMDVGGYGIFLSIVSILVIVLLFIFKKKT